MAIPRLGFEAGTFVLQSLLILHYTNPPLYLIPFVNARNEPRIIYQNNQSFLIIAKQEMRSQNYTVAGDPN